MAQYINKDILVAEIERLYDEKGAFYAADVLYNLEEWLDTLEVKEVDLDEEIEKCLKRHSMLALGKKDFTDIAKQFFELGIKAQKGE